MANLKVHSSLLKASLLKGGVTHVFMGRHGMKQYLVEKTLADLGDVPHPDFREGLISGSLGKADGQLVWGSDHGSVATLVSLLHHTKLALQGGCPAEHYPCLAGRPWQSQRWKG